MNDNFTDAIYDSVDILNEQYSQLHLSMSSKSDMQKIILNNFVVIAKISFLLTSQVISLNPNSDEWRSYIEIQTELTRARGLTVLELNCIYNDYQEDTVIRVQKDIGDLLDKLLEIIGT